jgi:hypothetical protein
MLRTEPTHLGLAKNLIAAGLALLAFVVALAVGTVGAPALGGLSWVMVTAGAAGIVYVGGVVVVAVMMELRGHGHRTLRPATVVSPRGDRPRSTAR